MNKIWLRCKSKERDPNQIKHKRTNARQNCVYTIIRVCVYEVQHVSVKPQCYALHCIDRQTVKHQQNIRSVSLVIFLNLQWYSVNAYTHTHAQIQKQAITHYPLLHEEIYFVYLSFCTISSRVCRTIRYTIRIVTTSSKTTRVQPQMRWGKGKRERRSKSKERET